MLKRQIITVVAFLAFLLPSLTFAIPVDLGISGKLLDRNGQPICKWEWQQGFKVPVEFQLAAQIKFYDSEISTSALATIDTQASCVSGYFSIPFQLPENLLTLDAIYYTLSLDTDENGLTEADLFNERFQVGAVPFALSAKPVNSFTAHGGSQGNANAPGQNLNYVSVAPFTTPAGGIRFNRMYVHVSSMGMNLAFSFGVYDGEGQLVVKSPLIDTMDVSISDAFLEVETPTITLNASDVYYTALTRRNSGIFLKDGLYPCAPVYGKIIKTVADGLLPDLFAPSAITIDNNSDVLPVTFSYVEEPVTAQMQKTTSEPRTGFGYRWIKRN